MTGGWEVAQHSLFCSNLWFLPALRVRPGLARLLPFPPASMSFTGFQFLGGAEPPPGGSASASGVASGRRPGRWGWGRKKDAAELAVAAAVALPDADDDLDGAESVAPTESVAGTDLVSEVGREMESYGLERLEEVEEEEEEVEEKAEEQVDEEQPSQVQEFAFRSAPDL